MSAVQREIAQTVVVAAEAAAAEVVAAEAAAAEAVKLVGEVAVVIPWLCATMARDRCAQRSVTDQEHSAVPTARHLLVQMAPICHNKLAPCATLVP
jgi:hypothetical protein